MSDGAGAPGPGVSAGTVEVAAALARLALAPGQAEVVAAVLAETLGVTRPFDDIDLDAVQPPSMFDARWER